MAIATDRSNRLRAGRQAIRDRLAQIAPGLGREHAGKALASDAPSVDAVHPTVVVESVAAPNAPAALLAENERPPVLPPARDLAIGVPLVPDSASADVGLDQASFSGLMAAHRPLASAAPRDHTFFYALGIVLLLHAGALVGTLRFDDRENARREREGQVEQPTSIAVELVEAPDAKSQEKRAQMGKVQPPAPPPVQAPPPQPPPQPEQAEQKPVTAPKLVEPVLEKPPEKVPEKPLEKPVEKPAEKAVEPVKPDEGPDPLKQPEPVKEAALEPPPLPQKPRDQVVPQDAVAPSPPPPPEATEFRGAAPEGKERAYAKGVREILAKTKPQIWVRKAEVKVGFVLSLTGELKFVKILETSRDPIFDDVILEWIKRAKFAKPPADAKPDDLEHIIHFTVQ